MFKHFKVQVSLAVIASCFHFFLIIFFRIQEQLRRIKRNQEKEKLQPVKKKKEKPPNNVTVLSCFESLSFSGKNWNYDKSVDNSKSLIFCVNVNGAPSSPVVAYFPDIV